MPRQRFTNNAVGELNVQCLSTDLSLTLKPGQGSKFPAPFGGDFFIVTLQNGSTVEIVKCTGRSSDVLTIVRAQEGTSATTFAADTSLVELRATAGGFERFLQELTADMFIAMGVVDLMGVGGFENAILETPEIINPLLQVGVIYPVDGGSDNAITLPDGGGRPSIAGSPLATDTTVAAQIAAAITSKQNLDATLTALAALTGPGYIKASGTDAFSMLTQIPYSDISGGPSVPVTDAANVDGTNFGVFKELAATVLKFRTFKVTRSTVFAGVSNNKVTDVNISMDYDGDSIRIILTVTYNDDIDTIGVGMGVGVGMDV